MENQNIKYKDVPLIKEIEKCNDNILYYGEGGIGKTTQMQLAFNYFSSKCTNTVPVFLDADKEIDFRKADPLMSAIACKYLGSDIETDDIWKLFTNNSPSSAKNYTYIIFVDGINELTQNNKGYLIEKITHIISESKNTRFIISSRIKENLGLRLKNIAIKPLEKKNILKYLGENYGANDNSKNINDSLVEILQIPLYLSVFKNTYNSSDYKPNIYDESTVRKADILDSYIQKILHEKRETNAADTALFEFIVKYFLPALAFKMVKDNVHVISIMDFRKLRDNTKYFEAFCYDENALDIFEQNSRKAHNYIVENFALLESHNDVYTFSHQIWRDYFCAKHIINCLNVTYSEQIQNDLETPVDNEIRGFVGQLIYTYDEKFHYSKEEHFPPEKSDRMCECDFEAKDNLEDWDESPIEHYMQKEYYKINQSSITIDNLIKIMKVSRQNNITACYDNLHLEHINFAHCDISNSSFKNTTVSELCFSPIGHKNDILTMTFVDNDTKIFTCDENGNYIIWEAKSGLILNKYSNPCMEFCPPIVSNDGDKIIELILDNVIRITEINNNFTRTIETIEIPQNNWEMPRAIHFPLGNFNEYVIILQTIESDSLDKNELQILNLKSFEIEKLNVPDKISFSDIFAFCEASNLLVSYNNMESELIFFNIVSKKLSILNFDAKIESLTISSDGNFLLISKYKTTDENSNTSEILVYEIINETPHYKTTLYQPNKYILEAVSSTLSLAFTNFCNGYIFDDKYRATKLNGSKIDHSAISNIYQIGSDKMLKYIDLSELFCIANPYKTKDNYYVNVTTSFTNSCFERIINISDKKETYLKHYRNFGFTHYSAAREEFNNFANSLTDALISKNRYKEFFSNDGLKTAKIMYDYNNLILIINNKTNSLEATIKPKNTKNNIIDIVFSPNCIKIAVVSKVHCDVDIMIYDLMSNKSKNYLIKKAFPVLSNIFFKAIFTPDNKRLIVSFVQGIIVIDKNNVFYYHHNYHNHVTLKNIIESNQTYTFVLFQNSIIEIWEIKKDCSLAEMNKVRLLPVGILNCDFSLTKYLGDNKTIFFEDIYSNGGVISPEKFQCASEIIKPTKYNKIKKQKNSYHIVKNKFNSFTNKI